MAFTDWYCEKCSLQFDKKMIFDMHLSIVHKEVVDIKEKPDETSTEILVQCEMCSKTFSHRGNMKRHIVTFHEKKKPFKSET